MQSSFSWDWGPAFPTMGLHRPASLHLFSHLFLHRFTLLPILSATGTGWSLQLRARVWAVAVGSVRAEVSVAGLERVERELRLRTGWNEIRLLLPLSNSSRVQLWWPAGLGTQPLYPATLILSSSQDRHIFAQSNTLHVAFRTIRLRQPLTNPKVPNQGRDFFVEVNLRAAGCHFGRSSSLCFR